MRFTTKTSAARHFAGLAPMWDSGLDIVHFKANITPSFLSKVGVFSVGGIYRSGDQIGANIDALARLALIAKLTPAHSFSR